MTYLEQCEGCSALVKTLGYYRCGILNYNRRWGFITDCPCSLCLVKPVCRVVCESLHKASKIKNYNDKET